MEGRVLRLLTTGLFVASIAFGCGEADIVSPHEVQDYSGPWQATPFAIDVAALGEAERTCRATVPQDLPLVVVDARGGNAWLLIYAVPDRQNDCLLVRNAAGTLVPDGGGASSRGGPQPALGPNDVRVLGGSSQSRSEQPGHVQEARTLVSGTVGPGVAAVDIVLEPGHMVRASLASGWFAAWWPSEDMDFVVRGLNGAGNVVSTWP